MGELVLPEVEEFESGSAASDSSRFSGSGSVQCWPHVLEFRLRVARVRTLCSHSGAADSQEQKLCV